MICWPKSRGSNFHCQLWPLWWQEMAVFITQGFFQRWGGHLLPLGHAENFIFFENHLYKSFNEILNGINFCARTATDFTKLRLIKGPNSKFPRESMPPGTPSLLHACTQICAYPPKIHTISFCSLSCETGHRRHPMSPHTTSNKDLWAVIWEWG